jgi:diaminopimelate decarboxylase
MTLSELIPSLGRAVGTRLAAGVWPASARLRDGDLIVGGVSMARLAATFGNPAHVIDEAEVRRACRTYRATLPEAEISYASKALLTHAIARWMREEGMSLDACSAGEVAIARRSGIPAGRITLHGNAKTSDELKAVAAGHVGRVVVDSFDEIDQLAGVARDGQEVLVRVTPGIDAHTHAAITTGVDDQKFGFSLADGAAAEAVRRVLEHPALRLVGLHCHLGSQITRVACFEDAVNRMVGLMACLRDEHGAAPTILNLGGGHAARYTAADDEFDLAAFANRVRVALACACDRHRLPLPRLAIEPGRALVARAGVTLYRVVAVKHTRHRTFVAVDGGMSDNLRPALYGARYTAIMIGRTTTAPMTEMTVAGRHCEAGDLLAQAPLPEDIQAGDLLAVPCTGAYHHAMASNYNVVCRPPLIAVHDGEPRVLVRRETEDDLFTRDVGR